MEASSDFDGVQFIGEVLVRWVPLEMFVKSIIGMLVTLDPETGRVLTWDAEWAWLEKYLEPLVRQRTGGDDQALELARQARIAVAASARHRSRLAHSTMGPLVSDSGVTEWHSFKLVGRDHKVPPVDGTLWTAGEVGRVKKDYASAVDAVLALSHHLYINDHLYEWPLWYFPPLDRWDDDSSSIDQA